MTSVNDLKTIDAIATDDFLVGYKTRDVDARKIEMSVLLDFLEDNLDFPNGRYVTQILTASTDGYTVEIENSDEWIWAFINQGGEYTSGTIVFPSIPIDQQEILIKVSHTNDDITVNGNGKSVVAHTWGVIEDETESARFKYDDTSATWYYIE